MELTVVPIVKPDDANFIFGQSHFIKTVEDLHEAGTARGAGGRGSGHPVRAGLLRGLGQAAGALVG